MAQIEKTYEERKKELINHFINHTIWVFTNEIKQSYPYDISMADLSPYKDALRGQLNIPAYPISDEEFDEIIDKISDYLKRFVNYLILEDEKKRIQLSDSVSSNPSFYLDGFDEEKGSKKL